ncbi:MAG: hypothetical protein WC565_08760 [Parcubacteria group bacterium]
MAYVGHVKRPKASLSAVVIKADGTRVDLGMIAGEGRNDPANLEKGKAGRERLDAMLAKEKKEAHHGG